MIDKGGKNNFFLLHIKSEFGWFCTSKSCLNFCCMEITNKKELLEANLKQKEYIPIGRIIQLTSDF